MSHVEKCKAILAKMRQAGYEVIEDETVNLWSQDDIEYFLANYESSYLGDVNE